MDFLTELKTSPSKHHEINLERTFSKTKVTNSVTNAIANAIANDKQYENDHNMETKTEEFLQQVRLRNNTACPQYFIETRMEKEGIL